MFIGAFDAQGKTSFYTRLPKEGLVFSATFEAHANIVDLNYVLK